MIAYTLVVIGIPYLAGLIFGQILTLPVAMIRGIFRQPTDEATQVQEASAATAWSVRGSIRMSMADRIVHVFTDVCNGLGAILVAALIFHLFGFPSGSGVLFIPAAWAS